MKTLIINGSPRKNGDTAGLLNLFIPSLPGEYRLVEAYRADIAPCMDCRWCRTHPRCIIQDEMQEIYDYLQTCDNILIASPIYFSELTGKLLDFGSRLQAYFAAQVFRKKLPPMTPKKGAVILVGGGTGNAQKPYETAKMLLKLMNCQEIHEPVCSHRTDEIPAVKDPQAIEGLQSILHFFTEVEAPEETP